MGTHSPTLDAYDMGKSSSSQKKQSTDVCIFWCAQEILLAFLFNQSKVMLLQVPKTHTRGLAAMYGRLDDLANVECSQTNGVVIIVPQTGGVEITPFEDGKMMCCRLWKPKHAHHECDGQAECLWA